MGISALMLAAHLIANNGDIHAGNNIYLYILLTPVIIYWCGFVAYLLLKLIGDWIDDLIKVKAAKREHGIT